MKGLKPTLLKKAGEMRAAARLLSASDPWLELGLTAKSTYGMMRTPFRETWRVEIDGQTAGIITITMYGTFKGYIQALYVAPGFRSRRIGEKLLTFAEKKILKEAKNVFLCVSSFNRRAIRFYKRLGYERVGVLKDFVARGYDEYLMRKTIGPVLKTVRTKQHGKH
jgi:ribosomal-protein-alanine N-acetyltransferase